MDAIWSSIVDHRSRAARAAISAARAAGRRMAMDLSAGRADATIGLAELVAPRPTPRSGPGRLNRIVLLSGSTRYKLVR